MIINHAIAYSPEVKPVELGVIRPLWSVMIPTYNCAEYLAQTLISVVKQAPAPEVMEIVVVDNCSTDNTEAIVREIGRGRVKYFRQSENVGSLKNFQTCLEMARGELIHILHSDDCVCEGFYQKMARPFLDNPILGAAFCRSIYIDSRGNWEGISDLEIPESGTLPQSWLEKIAATCAISVPSLAVVRRSVYEQLGGWDSRCGLSGDWEMWVRIFQHYPIWFEVEPLAMWRRHDNSTNVSNAKSFSFIQENYQTVEIILSYLPKSIRHRVEKKVKRNCACLALASAEFSFLQSNPVQGLKLLKKALKYSFSLRVILSVCRIIIQSQTLRLANLFKLNTSRNFSNRQTQITQ